MVSFYFGIQFKAKYLPAVLILFNFLTAGQEAAIISATGAIAAYVFWRLEHPHGPDGQQLPPSQWTQPPQFFKRLLPGAWTVETGRTTGTRSVPRSFGRAYFTAQQSNSSSRPPLASQSSSYGARTTSSSTSSDTNAAYRWGRGNRLGE